MSDDTPRIYCAHCDRERARVAVIEGFDQGKEITLRKMPARCCGRCGKPVLRLVEISDNWTKA